MKTNYLLAICLTALLPKLNISLFGQENTGNDPASQMELIDRYFSMSPEELFKISTHLTTGSAQGWLETPSATFVVTRDELMNSGHQRLAEQMRLIPGMQVSQNTHNTWAIATRSFQQAIANQQLVL